MGRGVLPVLLVVACGSSTSTAPSGDAGAPDACATCADGGARQPLLWLLNHGGKGLASWPLGGDGNVAPSGVVTGSQTGLLQASSLAVDGAGNLCVATPQQLLVFDHDPSGNVAPAQDLAGSNLLPSGQNFTGAVLSPDGTLIYALSSGPGMVGQISVWSPAAMGPPKPLRVIAGPTTQIQDGRAFAIFAGELYEADLVARAINVFDANASGDAAPKRVLMVGADDVAQIAFGPKGEIVLARFGNAPSIQWYAPGAQGNAIPIVTIAGPSTGLDYPDGVAVDAAGETYAAEGQDTGTPSIRVFAAGANGDATPVRTISGLATTIEGATNNGAMALVIY